MKTERNESARGVSPHFVGQHRPGKSGSSHSPSPQPSPQGEGEPFPVLISSLPLHTSARAARPPLLGERVGVRGNLTVKWFAQLGRTLVAQISNLSVSRHRFISRRFLVQTHKAIHGTFHEPDSARELRCREAFGVRRIPPLFVA